MDGNTLNNEETDDEIEAAIFSRRNDPDAWEILPFVPASSSPRPDWMRRKKDDDASRT